MLKIHVKVVVGFMIMLCFGMNGYSAGLKASLGQLPIYSESPEKGILVDLIKAIETESGKQISISVMPFARSINNVITGDADFHMPLIAPGNAADGLDYAYSTATIFHVNFVLYTKKNSGITKDNLKNAKVETDIAHTNYFDFNITGSANPEQSLKKVNAGRIDAFVFADFAMDPLIKKNDLTNIKRDLYRTYEVKIVLPKGGTGGTTDTLLSQTIEKIRAKGEYEKIMGIALAPYDNWQP